jgi:hypothetical protein
MRRQLLTWKSHISRPESRVKRCDLRQAARSEMRCLGLWGRCSDEPKNVGPPVLRLSTCCRYMLSPAWKGVAVFTGVRRGPPQSFAFHRSGKETVRGQLFHREAACEPGPRGELRNHNVRQGGRIAIDSAPCPAPFPARFSNRSPSLSARVANAILDALRPPASPTRRSD